VAGVASADHARIDGEQIIAANLSVTPTRHGLSSDDASSPWDDFTTLH
jgi:hypothetical protein